MPDKPTIPWGAVPKDEDPLITFKTVQAQVGALVQRNETIDAQFGEIRQTVGEIKTSVKDVPAMVGEIRAAMTYTTGEIKELKARVETIDENKLDIKEMKIEIAQVKEKIIPDGKILFAQLSAEFQEYKGKNSKIFWGGVVSVCVNLAWIVKDYIFPVLWPLIHK